MSRSPSPTPAAIPEDSNDDESAKNSMQTDPKCPGPFDAIAEEDYDSAADAPGE